MNFLRNNFILKESYMKITLLILILAFAGSCSNFLSKKDKMILAGVTGLEPAASCVTGRRSNQAELHPRKVVGGERLELPTLSV
jgi:hypothetical protein